MSVAVKSIRPFIGSKNFDESRAFYSQIGFDEILISKDMVYFNMEGFGFYLQDAYVKRWVDNTMLFLEMGEVETYLKKLTDLNLDETFSRVRISEIHYKEWGKEFFLHDPSGILWHIGNFIQKNPST